MFHKFVVKTTGVVFNYSTVTNAIYDSEKNLLSRPLGKTNNEQAPNDFISSGEVVKINSPREIKIVFGHKCNYACGYCIQKDIGDHDSIHPSKATTSSRATQLIANLKASLDLSRLEQLELWGGEIFLFWKEVQEVMRAFDRPGFDFVMPTNGTLLDERHIDFFSSLEGRVTLEIGHDGPQHELTRGPDFLDKLAPTLRYMEGFREKVRAQFTVVVSRNNFKFREINDYFHDFYERNGLTPIPLFFMPIIVYDKFSRQHSIADINQYGDHLKDFLDEHIGQFIRLGKVADDALVQTALFHVNQDGDDNNGILQLAAKMRSTLDHYHSTICGMHQMDKLVVDISGNIKGCQNVGEAVFNGNIVDFAIDSSPKVIHGMNTSEQYKDKCQSCPVLLQCFGGCPLEFDSESFDLNCQLSTIHNMTRLLAAFKIIFKSEVEWLGPNGDEL